MILIKAIAGVLALLVWMILTAYVFLFGESGTGIKEDYLATSFLILLFEIGVVGL